MPYLLMLVMGIPKSRGYFGGMSDSFVGIDGCTTF
jgi:hypothetical protein